MPVAPHSHAWQDQRGVGVRRAWLPNMHFHVGDLDSADGPDVAAQREAATADLLIVDAGNRMIESLR